MDFSPESITRRVLEVAKALELKDVQLARDLSLSKQNVNGMKNFLMNVPLKKVLVFLAKHRDINTDWLLFGEGDMFGLKGIHKMTITNDDEIHFSSEFPGEKVKEAEIEQLEALLEEKEKHNKTLKASVDNQNEVLKNQNEYIKKLLDKL